MRDRPLPRSAAPAAGRADRFLERATVVLVLLLTPVAHLPLRQGEFVGADHAVVQHNPQVARGELLEPFRRAAWPGRPQTATHIYRPVVLASFAAERRLFGGPDPRIGRAVNLGLHLLATLALFALVRRLGARPLAVAGATLVFALHPLHVEAVAYLVGRAELLAALFGFLALVLFGLTGPWRSAAARPPARSPSRAAAWVAGICLFLALGSKEVAFALPPLMLAVEWLFPRRGPRRWLERLGAWAPSVLAILLHAILRVLAGAWIGAPAADPLDNALVELHGTQRLATALALLPRYVGRLFYPLHLSGDSTGPLLPTEPSLGAALPLLGLLLLLGLVLLSLSPLLLRREPAVAPRGAAVAFAALLFLLPYLAIGNLLVPIETLFAERLLYLPSAGFCLLLGLTLGGVASGWAPQVPGPRPSLSTIRLAALALAALISGFATLSWARCLDWRDDGALARAALRSHGTSPRAHLTLGRLHAARGELPDALVELERAVDADARLVEAWVLRGTLLDGLGRPADAEASLRRALRLDPQHAPAYAELGRVLRSLGREEEAERARRKARLCETGSPCE